LNGIEARGSDGRGPRAWQFAAQWSEFNAGSADIAHGFVDAARSSTQTYNVQAGLNWWPNKYTHFNLDYACTGFNCAILITGPAPVSQHNTVWLPLKTSPPACRSFRRRKDSHPGRFARPVS
jgi:hypothetical protein